MYEDLSKEELAKKMREKIQENLKEEGPANLIIHNLENFAYRYLETSENQNINCLLEGHKFWVESTENDILEALKWKNKEVKAALIDLCKEYPGPRSKEISIRLELNSTLKENKIHCQALINWDFPEFKSKDKEILRESTHHFEDYFELRNKHASWLEELTDIFI
jgi:hypothetical protein